MLPSLIAVACTSIIANSSEFEFTYVPIENRRVGIMRDKVLLVGVLDKHGDFQQERRHETMRSESDIIQELGIIRYSGPGFDHLYSMKNTPEKVYEYRSGILIPGVLGSHTRFVPDVGGTIIKFEDYKYSLAARRIWNLPGRFELKRVERDKKE